MRTWNTSESDLSESAHFSSHVVCGLQAGGTRGRSARTGSIRVMLVRGDEEHLNQGQTWTWQPCGQGGKAGIVTPT